jgi:hypothetical protein
MARYFRRGYDRCMIEELTRPVWQADIVGLEDVLVEAVESGASVSFLPPFGADPAQQWWRDTLASADVRTAFVVARDEVGIAGTVQLQPACRAPSRPHRSEPDKTRIGAGRIRSADLSVPKEPSCGLS